MAIQIVHHFQNCWGGVREHIFVYSFTRVRHDVDTVETRGMSIYISWQLYISFKLFSNNTSAHHEKNWILGRYTIFTFTCQADLAASTARKIQAPRGNIESVKYPKCDLLKKCWINYRFNINPFRYNTRSIFQNSIYNSIFCK